MVKIIAVASSKGGTGKTTAAINLGLALKKLGKDVIVVDANLDTPGIGLRLGAPVLHTTFHDVLEGDRRVTDALYRHASGLKIVPAGFSLNKLSFGSEKMLGAFSELSASESDIIIDTGPGVTRETLASLRAADETLIVTTPDLEAVTTSLKTIKLAEKLGSTVVGIVLNRVRKGRLEMSAKEIEETLGKNIIGVIPEDNTVRESIARRGLLLQLYPKSRAAVAFQKLASNLIGGSYIESIKKKRKAFRALGESRL